MKYNRYVHGTSQINKRPGALFRNNESLDIVNLQGVSTRDTVAVAMHYGDVVLVGRNRNTAVMLL